MNRRAFVAGLAGLAGSALVIPERKLWALDQTMLYRPGDITHIWEQDFFGPVHPPMPDGMIWWAEQVAARGPISETEKLTIQAMDDILRGRVMKFKYAEAKDQLREGIRGWHSEPA